MRSGAFRFQDTPPDDNQGATYQAVPALAGKTFPIEAILDRAASRARRRQRLERQLPLPLVGTNPVSTTATVVVTSTTPLLAATPVAPSPARLPDTGGSSAVPVLFVLLAGLLVVVRRRHAAAS